jgi:hypothetical protein
VQEAGLVECRSMSLAGVTECSGRYTIDTSRNQPEQPAIGVGRAIGNSEDEVGEQMLPTKNAATGTGHR